VVLVASISHYLHAREFLFRSFVQEAAGTRMWFQMTMRRILIRWQSVCSSIRA
jgi:hypothetical protein